MEGMGHRTIGQVHDSGLCLKVSLGLPVAPLVTIVLIVTVLRGSIKTDAVAPVSIRNFASFPSTYKVTIGSQESREKPCPIILWQQPR